MISFDILPFLCVNVAQKYRFIKEATVAPPSSTYDYIVIGGGSCGCPLAATLSQGGRVLLLERGGSPYTNPEEINIHKFVHSLADTTPSSFSQQFISTDGVLNSRARVLGGGSVLNAGFYSRASNSYIRASGWNESLAKSSYKWVEKKVAFEPPMMQWQTAVRDGLLEAGVLPYNGFTFDHLYGTKVGGSIFDKEGHRHTAADLLVYADPRKISVYLHATVQKILFRYNEGTYLRIWMRSNHRDLKHGHQKHDTDTHRHNIFDFQKKGSHKLME